MRSGARLAHRIVCWASTLVPRDRREAWTEEWLAELEALVEGPEGRPGPIEFARGSIRHAVWMRVDAWSLDGWSQDLAQALRSLGARPAFATVCVALLALGIGANTAVFSLLNGLLLKPPPGVAAPRQLVQIAQADDGAVGLGGFSWANMALLRHETQSLFAGVEGFSTHQFVLGDGEERRASTGYFVTGGWFELLGVEAAVGRMLRHSDDREVGAHPVVVLSWELWVREFGGDPSVLGRRVFIDGAPHTVVGVAPEGFVGIHSNAVRPQLFVPSMMHPAWSDADPADSWRWSWLNLVARRLDGVDEERASGAADRLTETLRAAHPDNARRRVAVLPGAGLEPWAARETQRLGMTLAWVVGLVLLLTCVSLANLFSARAAARADEFGIRRALGAGRGRIARQLLAEAALISGLAMIAALPMAFLAQDLLPRVVPLPVTASLGPDLRVFSFLAGVGALTALLFGGLPAWSATRHSPAGAIRGSAGSGPSTASRLRDALVVVQLAFSLALLTGGALLTRSLQEGVRADPGFTSRGLLGAVLTLPEGAEEQRVDLYARLAAAAGSRPEVRAAAVSSQLPVAGGQSMGSVWRAEGGEAFEVESVAVGPGWFATLGITLVEGREPLDDGEVVVDVELARILFAGGGAVGRTLWAGETFRVVGIAPRVRMRSLRADPNPAAYFPVSQAWPGRIALAVSLREGAVVAPETVLDWIREVDPELRGWATDVRSEVLAALDDARALGLLVGGFAMLALILSAGGLWGLVSEGARARTREFGIRIALGARSNEIRRLALGRAVRLVGLGILVGIPLAWAAGRGLEGVLFGVGPADLLAYAVAAALMGAIGLLASWLPAAHAVRIDPKESLTGR